MYEDYWGLSRTPFSGNLRDFYYESPVHDEASARLWYLAEQQRRCGILTGPAGTGKSALLMVLADQLARTARRVVYVDVDGLGGDELLWQSNAELGLFPGPLDSPLLLWRKLQDYLYGLRAGRLATVFVFDHIDRAGADCRGTVERLMRHEARLPSAVTTLLAGRSLPTWQGLADLRIELDCLDRRQTAIYIHTATKAAGADQVVFDDSAVEKLFVATRGVPRDINRLADLALLAGMSLSRQVVDADAVTAAEAMLNGGEIDQLPASTRCGSLSERFETVEN